MFSIIQYIIATLLFATSIYTILSAIRISYATRRQRQLSTDIANCGGSLGIVGCSVICCQNTNINQLKALLSNKFDHYEVIIVVDANLHPEPVSNIIFHYKMMRVNTPEYTELQHLHIRALYRSRQKCFRRLILIDQSFISPYDDMNAAITIASYDYLIPLIPPLLLRQGAIDDIIISLSQHPDCEIYMMRSNVDGCTIFQRDAIVDEGGFKPKSYQHFTRHKTLFVNYPLYEAYSELSASKYTYTIILFIAIVLGCYLLFDVWIALIALLTLAIIISSAKYLAHSIERDCSSRTTLCYIMRFKHIFCRSDFLIS